MSTQSAFADYALLCGFDANTYDHGFTLMSKLLHAFDGFYASDNAGEDIQKSLIQMHQAVKYAANTGTLTRGKAMLLVNNLKEIGSFTNGLQQVPPRDPNVREMMRGVKQQVESLWFVFAAVDDGEDTGYQGLPYGTTRKTLLRESTKPGRRTLSTPIPDDLQLQAQQSSGALSSSRTRSPALSSSRTRSPALSSSRTRSPALSSSRTRSPALSSSRTRSPALSSSRTRSPTLSSSRTASPARAQGELQRNVTKSVRGRRSISPLSSARASPALGSK